MKIAYLTIAVAILLLAGSGHAAEEPRVQVEDDGTGLTLIVDGKNVLRYHYEEMPPPEGKNAKFRRSGFIHPLWAPDGQVLTTIHPADHIHHMGLWHPWTKTEFDGRHIDFWNLGSGEGTCRFVKVAEVKSGAPRGGFKVMQEVVDLKAPGGERVVLDEELKVTAGSTPEGAFLVDYTITQRCATDLPLTLVAYRYGGFGFRGTEAWHGTNSFMVTSEGKNRDDGHASRARWCNVFGTAGSGPAGIVFMSHPSNHAHPEPMRLWDSKSNRGRSNVFFNFCPVQQEPWTLEPGRDYVRRYRMYVYAGATDAEKAETLWKAFAAE